jgi:isopentenyl-diphosphate delta-isomerase
MTPPRKSTKSRSKARKGSKSTKRKGLTEKRKADHVHITLNEEVNARYNFWDDIQLVHNAIPEVDKDEIDLSVELFGKELKAPIVIAGMTGGYDDAREINANLAQAAAELGLGMGVGSQRAAL